MQLHLHGLTIRLEATAATVANHCRRLFHGWLQDASGRPDLAISLMLADSLPSPPPGPPRFVDPEAAQRGAGALTVYGEPQGETWLHFRDSAQVTMPPLSTSRGVAPRLTVTLTAAALAAGQLEDVLFTSLAPWLRRRGFYLLHAFAARRAERCVLIVGPSGSGKTTTGLALWLAGWQVLANDVLLLQQRAGQVVALPTPGLINIRPGTLTLLPALRLHLPPPRPGAEYQVSPSDLDGGRHAPAASVTTLLFPHVVPTPELPGSGTTVALQPLVPAVALAQMMSESIDRWDRPALPAHIGLLQALANQGSSYTLSLGPDLRQLPALVAAT